ncbi:hypothetical protein FHU39_003035 [Flexivirga oryzae]|uniref:Replication initiation protein n=2 Tax=Flexivirga oryzae TaxID=1794944 RepID=A0A839N6W9_9MICO|nr:hypothetical protein [Flexivirga oryzae]
MSSDALSPSEFAGFGESAPLDVPGLDSAHAAVWARGRFSSRAWDAWSQAAASVGHCSRPVRLHGSSVTVDRRTGEVLSSFRSTDAPLGVLLRRCGNRRDHVCPSCSRLYARDTFEMIRAGVQGGKQVPQTVADNPLVFLTVTAPSFGLVHGTRHGGACRPRRRDDRTRCPHGRATWCQGRHNTGDAEVGSPLCPDCYDYASHVIWQWWAPELWRRLTIEVRRRLADQLGVRESRLGTVASLQYAKVAEYQARGLIHFHALVRLDGPKTDGIGAPASPLVDGRDLAALLAAAVAKVSYTPPLLDQADTPRVLRLGQQVDTRAVRIGARTDDPAGPVTPGQVAGYLTKYATKGATAAASVDRRSTTPHLARVRCTCVVLADRSRAADRDGSPDPYALLGRWSHMLGFRGHFSTKSRAYSITLGALRRARARWQAIAADSRRSGHPIDTAELEARLLAADDAESTLVVGSWAYAGTGWEDSTEAALATATAARAREYDQWRAQHHKTRRNALEVKEIR